MTQVDYSDVGVKRYFCPHSIQSEKANIIKEWYDGYVFGDSFVYCPWDVINYMAALKKRSNAKPKNYWKNTSHSDEQSAAKVISDLLWKTISYNDYHKDYYHAFLAGAFVGLGYDVAFNKEKGPGRPDILLKDKVNRRAIIIEAKKSGSEDDLDKDYHEAIRSRQRNIQMIFTVMSRSFATGSRFFKNR